MNHRVRVIADMVRPGLVVADIGTDHAQLPIYLVREGRCKKAYACDITAGPVAIAAENIAMAGLSSQIETVQSDGFENIPEDCDCAVIAGMGYYTIRDILSEARKSQLDHLKQLLVQSNTDLILLRQWIQDKNWSIADEVLISEKGHDYVAMEIDTHTARSYSEIELYCGPVLLEKGGDDYIAYCKKQILALEKLLEYRHNDQDIQHLIELWNLALHRAEE